MDTRRNNKKQYPTGVKPHGENIQIKFIWPKHSKKYVYKTLAWSSTPANLIRAGKLRQEIIDAISHDTYRWSDYFPDDIRSQTRKIGTYYDYVQTWLDNPENDWKPQTRYKFKGIAQRIWMPALHDKQINKIKYTDLSAALKKAHDAFKDKNGKTPSASLYNDWLTCIRGPFATAVKDKAVTRDDNPALDFDNKKRIAVEADPFNPTEADAIINSIYKHDGERWGAWFELGFYSGLRYPSEPSALHWQSVDLSRGEIKISQIYSKHADTDDGIQKSTKTSVARTVRLNTRSTHALKIMRAITATQDKYVFLNQSNLPLKEATAQLRVWRSAIKRLNLRYRDPYTMRHYYATFGLMNGANPAFMAKQLGHSIEEFFKTYATWIDRMSGDTQMDLIESGITNESKTWQENSKKI